jgi:NADH:ubiquinone oxidoreductase subunit
VQAVPTNTGQPDAYQPKGAWLHGAKRRGWRKFEAWAPPAAAAKR